MAANRIFEGQSLWWVGSDNAKTQRAVSITKIGRKWATLSNGHRIDIESMAVDGGGYNPPGECYESQQAYEQAIALLVAWQKFTRDVRDMQRPTHMTIEKIAQVRALLSI